jgi:uncharacterized delta-60 repeat protein
MNNSLKFLPECIVILLLLSPAHSTHVEAQVVEEWVARYSGVGDDQDVSYDVAVDQNGNVYVTGFSFGGPTLEDYVTIKYNAEGTELWRLRYNGPGNGGDWANAITLDADANAYVTGMSYGDGWTGYDYATIKYSTDGVEQWVARYNGTGSSWDDGSDLVVDIDGNIFVTGHSSGIGTNLDVGTVKYNSEGVLQWEARYTSPGDQIEGGKRILLDPNGNVIVIGYENSQLNTDWVTLKYNSDGEEQWGAVYNGPGDSNDTIMGLALDADGNVYVTGGATMIGGFTDYVTIKYNPDGIVQWMATYDGLMTSLDRASSVAVSSGGNVFITGQSRGIRTDDDFATIKYNSYGEELWVARYDGPGHDVESAPDIVIDTDENVYISGPSRGALLYYDYATIKYNRDGVEQWVVRYDGPAGEEDQQWAMAIDENRNVYVTGESNGIGTFRDYATIKYGQVDAEVEVTLTPYGAPIQIPAAGGSFSFNVEVVNRSTNQVNSEIWFDVTLPYSTIPVTIIGPVTLNLLAGFIGDHDCLQEVPGGAPAGLYRFYGRMGVYPDAIWSHDEFTFEKLTTGDGEKVQEWAFQGNVFDELFSFCSESAVRPTEFCLVRAYPNPFNASTTFRLELTEAGSVTLEVFDVGGRLWGSPLQGRWLQTGVHEIPFGGSDLPSGIYIYRFRMEDSEVGGKVVLLK